MCRRGFHHNYVIDRGNWPLTLFDLPSIAGSRNVAFPKRVRRHSVIVPSVFTFRSPNRSRLFTVFDSIHGHFGGGSPYPERPTLLEEKVWNYFSFELNFLSFFILKNSATLREKSTYLLLISPQSVSSETVLIAAILTSRNNSSSPHVDREKHAPRFTRFSTSRGGNRLIFIFLSSTSPRLIASSVCSRSVTGVNAASVIVHGNYGCRRRRRARVLLCGALEDEAGTKSGSLVAVTNVHVPRLKNRAFLAFRLSADVINFRGANEPLPLRILLPLKREMKNGNFVSSFAHDSARATQLLWISADLD